jgi:hypothetical protein
VPENPQSLTDLLETIERLLVESESDWALDTCYFRVRFGPDPGHLLLRITPTVEQARAMFEVDGNQFTAPKVQLGGHFRAGDGTITRAEWNPPPPPPGPAD